MISRKQGEIKKTQSVVNSAVAFSIEDGKTEKNPIGNFAINRPVERNRFSQLDFILNLFLVHSQRCGTMSNDGTCSFYEADEDT